MSELNAKVQITNDERLVYIKSEADKVIADLKARIAQLEDDNALLSKNNAELRSKNEGLLYALADAETDLAMATRWRKCSEELPPEDMEGEDFIVSNGFYSVICEWRGYWNNEPFMGDKNCDTVKYWTFAPKAPEEE